MTSTYVIPGRSPRSHRASLPRLASLAFILLVCLHSLAAQEPRAKPRVFVTTDINNGSGDPDDRQSLCHLLWHADVLDIRAIVPDRFKPSAVDACQVAFDLYEKDFRDPSNHFSQRAFPEPDYFRETVLVSDRKQAVDRLIKEAKREADSPLWVLAWGNLRFVSAALAKAPEIAPRIRLITIGTFRHSAKDEGNGKRSNWNGAGRQVVYDNFPKLWWLEIDWTYNGMFPGQEAIDLKDQLAAAGGNLGRHVRDVIDDVSWADNFRAGDTPTVLYVTDPSHDLDDPSQPSWAGQFVRPFPKLRPNYWTGTNGGFDWDFSNPSKTWRNADKVYQARVATLLRQRPNMYRALLQRVQALYGVPDDAVRIRKRAPLPLFNRRVPLILQSESCELRGGSSPINDPEAQGGRSVQLSGRGACVWRFRFDAMTGRFPIRLRYKSVQKVELILFMNSAKIGKLSLEKTDDAWQEYETELQLQEGPNLLSLENASNVIQIDWLSINPLTE